MGMQLCPMTLECFDQIDYLVQDNVFIAYEAYHYLKNKRVGNRYEVAIKTDMKKAYDRIEWDFLKAVLLKLGFCEA